MAQLIKWKPSTIAWKGCSAHEVGLQRMWCRERSHQQCPAIFMDESKSLGQEELRKKVEPEEPHCRSAEEWKEANQRAQYLKEKFLFKLKINCNTDLLQHQEGWQGWMWCWKTQKPSPGKIQNLSQFLRKWKMSKCRFSNGTFYRSYLSFNESWSGVTTSIFQDASHLVKNPRRSCVRPPLRLRDILQRGQGDALLATRLVPLQVRQWYWYC